MIEDASLVFTQINRFFGFALKLSKSGLGQLLEFLGLMGDLSPLPAAHPVISPPRARRDKLMAQIGELLGCGEASPARLQKLVGKPSFAGSSPMGKIARTMLRPLYIPRNSETASRGRPLQARVGLVRRLHAPLTYEPKRDPRSSILPRFPHAS